jgi:hypothetical protein
VCECVAACARSDKGHYATCIPPGESPRTVPDRVRSPACAGGCTAAAVVVFFPGGAADELTARQSRSRRGSGPVSTNWCTLSTRNATLSTDVGHTWDSIQGTLSTHIEQLWVLLVLTGHYYALQLPGVSTQGNH